MYIPIKLRHHLALISWTFCSANCKKCSSSWFQKEVVYGLTEILREEIKGARLVANPGCYPTSVQLPLVPLIKVCVLYISSQKVTCSYEICARGQFTPCLRCNNVAEIQTYIQTGEHCHSLIIFRGNTKCYVLTLHSRNHNQVCLMVLVLHFPRRPISLNLKILLLTRNLVLAEQVRIGLQFITFPCKILLDILLVLHCWLLQPG